ncbi:MAG: hypothetical protein JHC87_10050 [Thermoleophilaceae bacterium]|nr:hypothetical protein [Thermoleophilaceae bacterium]
MDDPGGLLGIGIVLTAAACAAAIGWVDRKWPRIGLGILIVAGTIGVGFHLLMRYGPIDSDILQGQQVEWWLVALAFVPLGVYVLAAWHARHHQREGALVLLVFGLLFAVSIVPGLVLSQPAILCGVLLLASDHLAAKRQQPTT